MFTTRPPSAGAAETAEAAAEFVKQHLAPMGEPVWKRLENFAPDYLIAAGRMVTERVGPAPRSAYPLAPTEATALYLSRFRLLA